jgi:hypothetical protein
MNARRLLAALAVCALGVPATASAVAPYFSLDRSSVNRPPDSAADVFDTPKATSLSHLALGLPFKADVDAVSPGDDFFVPIDPCPTLIGKDGRVYSPTYLWSVDRASIGSTTGGSLARPGAPCVSSGQPVRIQALAQDAPADVFLQMFGAPPTVRWNVLLWDQSLLGLLGGNLDDLDALEVRDPLTGMFVPDQRVFFSVRPRTARLLGVSAASVLVSPPGTPMWSVAWSPAALGLKKKDDIDALCVGSGSNPYLLISLGRNSPSLAAGGYSPADVFKVRPGLEPFPGLGMQVPFLTAAFLSLEKTDNLDGLDCVLGDPAHALAAPTRASSPSDT